LPIRVPTPVVARHAGYGALPKTLAVTELSGPHPRERSAPRDAIRIVDTQARAVRQSLSEFKGEEALYTAVYLIAMNKARFEACHWLCKASSRPVRATGFGAAGLANRPLGARGARTVKDGGVPRIRGRRRRPSPWKAAAKDQIATWIAARDAAGDDARCCWGRAQDCGSISLNPGEIDIGKCTTGWRFAGNRVGMRRDKKGDFSTESKMFR